MKDFFSRPIPLAIRVALILALMLLAWHVSTDAVAAEPAPRGDIGLYEIISSGMLLAIIGGLLRVEGRLTRLETEMRFALGHVKRSGDKDAD